MPSLFRFLFIVALLAGLAYGAMIALVTFVQPQPREMTQTIPASRFNK
ncbi:MAG: histidine kinase [Methylobacteriaceae bacterium]|nr:histidine kinase [Methylobacteriaceae bacterium]MBV9218312.1 histidine kinase [Methylobacteriaceae bacterium]MBV9244954.1 histidine kinase [Methylobacteriaceae bacterium]MBV9634312.1 histidine kinase [Methylobacteriaceae bacterium]MBV9703620.1 histidine kinase [Methylobacteriaceae bacterium]